MGESIRCWILWYSDDAHPRDNGPVEESGVPALYRTRKRAEEDARYMIGVHGVHYTPRRVTIAVEVQP